MQRPDFEKISALLEENREKFSAFRSLLLAYNEKFNLTAVTEERDVLYKHFIDSLAGEALFPKGASVAEVGSGAGFPSVPLMLVRDDCVRRYSACAPRKRQNTTTANGTTSAAPVPSHGWTRWRSTVCRS